MFCVYVLVLLRSSDLPASRLLCYPFACFACLNDFLFISVHMCVYVYLALFVCCECRSPDGDAIHRNHNRALRYYLLFHGEVVRVKKLWNFDVVAPKGAI